MPRTASTPEPRKRLSKEEMLQRRNMAIDLRRAGITLDVIAARLNYPNVQAVQRDIDLLISSVLKTPQDEMRGLEALRLDYMTMVLWPEARKGINRAIDQLLKVMERRAKLFGLDAPVQVEQITLDGIETAIKELEKELDTNDRAKLPKPRRRAVRAEDRFGPAPEPDAEA